MLRQVRCAVCLKGYHWRCTICGEALIYRHPSWDALADGREGEGPDHE